MLYIKKDFLHNVGRTKRRKSFLSVFTSSHCGRVVESYLTSTFLPPWMKIPLTGFTTLRPLRS